MEQFSGAMTNMVYRCGLLQAGKEVQVRKLFVGLEGVWGPVKQSAEPAATVAVAFSAPSDCAYVFILMLLPTGCADACACQQQ